MKEKTANELLKEIRDFTHFDWITDCVFVTFYRKIKTDRNMIARCSMLENMGEFLLEKYNVKRYYMGFQQYPDHKTIEIDIVLDMD